MPPLSPLAPASFAALPPVAGVRLAVLDCGVRYKNRSDVCLIALAPGTTVAGVLTRSLTASAPVEICRKHLTGGTARAVLINSGNANAFTGKAGKAAADRSVKAVADIVGCRAREVFAASTGLIGEVLPDERITRRLPDLTKALAADGWDAAARAIMTTDTFRKLATRTAEIDGVAVTINGIAKGSGMIAPDMATMLAFVATDAKIPAPVLQKLLSGGADRSFNCTTVDGDTSTSDTLLMFATGQAPHRTVKTAGERRLADFRAKLDDLLTDLACQVVRDGEGAQKFVTIDVAGAASDKAARIIGRAIAPSPLVKPAIAGEAANWGRHGGAGGRPRRLVGGDRRHRERRAGRPAPRLRRGAGRRPHEGP